jgi:hypothetical protein
MSEREHYYCQRKISGKSRLPVNQSLLGLLIYNSSKIYKINKKYFDERKIGRAYVQRILLINAFRDETLFQQLLDSLLGH